MPADREIRVKNLRHNIRYQDLFKVKAQKLIWQREKKELTKIFWNIIGVKERNQIIEVCNSEVRNRVYNNKFDNL